jgi:hypothetical protein
VTSPLAGLDPTQASASAIINAQLQQWGLQSLAGTVSDLIRQGYGADAITLQLQNTDAYRQRFKANDERVKKGLAALTPAEYIAAEQSYRQVLQQNGLPAGFYDQQSDLDTYLANDTSPDELNSRAKIAQSIWLSQDAETKAVWRDWYGLSDGHAIAAILDPDKALPQLQTQAAAAQAGAAARRDGLTADQGRITSYVDQGLSADQLAQGFSKIGQTLGATQAMAARFGGPAFTQADAEAATLQGSSPQLRRQQQLFDSEQALFAGRSAADQNTNNRNTTGSF